MNEQQIRAQFQIPSHYAYEADDGINWQFAFCYSTIEVDVQKGEAWETHMGYSEEEGIRYLTLPRAWPFETHR